MLDWRIDVFRRCSTEKVHSAVAVVTGMVYKDLLQQNTQPHKASPWCLA